MNLNAKFGFSRSQYKGLLLILLLNVVSIGYYFYDSISEESEEYKILVEYFPSENNIEEVKSDSLFSFNPNRISIVDFRALGLSKSLSERVINYREKGGVFRKNSDLLKIYGMDAVWYSRIKDSINLPHIESNQIESKKLKLRMFSFDPNKITLQEMQKMQLPLKLQKSWSNYLNSGGRFNDCNDLEKLYNLTDELLLQLQSYCIINKVSPEIVSVNVNVADSLSLIRIKGIGPVYASRIIQYRNRLGGFYNTDQLLEVYGIDSIVLKRIHSQIIIDQTSLMPLNINTQGFKELLKHPYLNFEQVKSIKSFQEEMGPIIRSEDLLQLEGFSKADITRLQPYLSFEIK